MVNLNCRTTQFNIVISLKTEPIDFYTRLDRVLNEIFMCNYLYITHDKDLNSEGEIKTKHVHILIFNNNERVRFSTMINKLAELLNVNPLAISIDKIISLNGSIQYLIHKNDLDKTQYDIADIQHNLDIEELELYLNTKNESLTSDRIIQVVRSCNCDSILIMKELGLNIYRAYRPVIVDIINSLKRY